MLLLKGGSDRESVTLFSALIGVIRLSATAEEQVRPTDRWALLLLQAAGHHNLAVLRLRLGDLAGALELATAAILHLHSADLSADGTVGKRAARRAALKGYFAIVAASAPTTRAVAPFGGASPVIGTNPFAVGMPGRDHPILIDTSAAAVTNRAIERAQRLGERLPFPALVAADGRSSDDPAVLKTDPPGAIRPAGGDEAGHKGFALGLLVEALTSGLAGLGRASDKPPAGNAVYLQLIDPGSFAGADAFTQETGVLADLCRAAVPRDPGHPVRVPGDRAAAMFVEQSTVGVTLHPEIMDRMGPLLEKYGIPIPQAVP